jgi:hypothetical protein
MTNRFRQTIFLVVLLILTVIPSFAQSAKETAARIATRDKLRHVLAVDGPKIGVTFQQVDKAPFNFLGLMKTGLTNSDELEIVIIVTPSSTITFRIYPHYHGGYINVDKAADSKGLMKKLLQLSDTNFLYWGADDTADVFCGYTITLESGFPVEVVDVVLGSIPNQDKFVADLAPFVGDKPAG